MTENRQTNFDGFYNLLTSLGVSGRDKRLDHVVASPISLSQQDLNMLYRGDDIVARICNLPANEMTKKWFKVKASEDGDREKIDAMMQELKRLGAKKLVNEALVWSRLHGGSVIIIGANDGRPMHEPLNEDAITSVDYLHVLDRWDMEVISVYDDHEHPNYRQPELYRIRKTQQPISGMSFTQRVKTVFRSQTDPEIHESRLIRFDGVLTPAVIKQTQLGWCDSVVTRVYDVVRDYQTVYSGVGLLMQDIGQTVYKMKDLAAKMAQDKENLILTRLQLMNVARSVARAIPIDMDGEDIVYPDQKIQGIPGVLEKFDIRLSMALGWPATVLLGQSPKGLNATGESDLTNWYDFIEGEQERNLNDQLEKLVRVTFKALDNEPESYSVSHNPLWQASAKEVAEERKTYAETDALNIDRGIYTAEEVAESRYSGDEFGTEINLDKDLRDTDAIPSADPADVPGLRDETEASNGLEPLQAGQITAMTDVVKAFNEETISQEQAVRILIESFDMNEIEARIMIGVEPFKKETPGPIVPAIPAGDPQAFPVEPEPEPDPDDDRTDSVEKRGEKWVVLSEEGKVLGEHETEAAALQQLRAIEAAKARG